jgi:hypothetical protein
MSNNQQLVTNAPSWSNPSTCPFCDDELASPGAAFMDHLKTNPDCEDGFDRWRTRVNDDIRGGWSG